MNDWAYEEAVKIYPYLDEYSELTHAMAAALRAAEKRGMERAAKIAENSMMPSCETDWDAGFDSACDAITAKIRAASEKQ